MMFQTLRWENRTGAVRFLQRFARNLIVAVLFPVEVVVRGVRHKRCITEVR